MKSKQCQEIYIKIMDENAKKDLARKLKSAFSVAETRAKRVQEIRKAKAEAGPVKDDPDKPNYKKYKFKNDLKTKTHRIIKGMKLHFKNGEWASYKLGKIDTVVGRARYGALSFEGFKKQIFRSFKDRLYTPDADKDIELDYIEEEKCSSVGGAGFHERK